MISLDDWKIFYHNITQQLSCSISKIDAVLVDFLKKLNDLILVYYNNNYQQDYFKKLAALTDILHITSAIQDLCLNKYSKTDQILLAPVKNIQAASLQKSAKLKILAAQQEIENALDSHETKKARALLAACFTQEEKDTQQKIAEYLIFKYCNDNKEENSAVLAIKLLQEFDVNFNCYLNYKHYTPLMEAADNNGKIAVIQALIGAGANINQGEKRNNRYITPLHLAACNGKSEYVQLLLSLGADPKNTYYTLSFLAEKKSRRNLEIIKLLIEAGMPVNEIDHENNTPLKIAIMNKNTEVAQLLLIAGAAYPDMVIEIIKSNNIDLLNFLLKTYFIDLPPDIPYFSLKYQVLPGSAISLPMFQFCFQKGMSLKNYTLSDKVVLQTPGAVKICLEKKAPLDMRFDYYSFSGGFKVSQEGEYYLAHFAATCANEESLSILISAGLDIMTRDKDGRTPLHYAAAYANPDAVKILILAGADINTVDNTGKTPLHWAVEQGLAQS